MAAVTMVTEVQMQDARLPLSLKEPEVSHILTLERKLKPDEKQPNEHSFKETNLYIVM